MGGHEVSAAEGLARAPILLLDTHTLIWLTDGNRKLGESSKAAIRQAYREDRAMISAITPWEIALLVSKGRVTLVQDVMDWINTALAVPGVRLTPLEPEIAVESTRLPIEMHPDPADRIIVATARHLGATLVTADQELLGLSKKGHFRGIDASK
jgi:PIN domain nuclease of toxin-antitoxin system